MTKTQATTIITADGLDWTGLMVDLIDSLAHGLSLACPGLSWTECLNRADRVAARWAE